MASQREQSVHTYNTYRDREGGGGADEPAAPGDIKQENHG